MHSATRRSFLKTSALAVGAGLTARLSSSAWANPRGANEAVRLGLVGLSWKGTAHIKQLLKQPGARIVALCDVDPRPLARAVEQVRGAGLTPFATTDARKLFERADVDAVVIATCNHWHALQTVWACQAGKDVYVEKPMAHTVWEGRKIIEAAERYGRVVQVGTQRRSDPGLQELARYLQSGALGKVRYVHTVIYHERKEIGRRLPWYPDWLDYDLYCGPAPVTPLRRNQLHYDWHWSWDTGNGEIGNNGVHVLDLALAFTGQKAPPRRVFSLGGRYGIDDSAETPNTMFTVCDYADTPIYFEHRALQARPGAGHMDQLRGLREGVCVLCEGGHAVAMAGGAAYDAQGKKIKSFAGDGGQGHMGNFLQAVRSRQAQSVTAPPTIGHAPTVLAHLGNISYRLGRAAPTEVAQRALEPFPAATDTLGALQKHLGGHGIDLARQPFVVGPWLELDRTGDQIEAVTGGDEKTLEAARYLLRETARPPYVMPEKV